MKSLLLLLATGSLLAQAQTISNAVAVVPFERDAPSQACVLVAGNPPAPAAPDAILPAAVPGSPPAPSPAPVAAPSSPQPLTGSFLSRLYKAYANDWTTTSTDSGPPPAYRGYPAPESDPPFPFTVWPYGGSPVLGQPFVQSGPLMEAIWSGSNGDWWKKSGIQIYGWLNGGFNVSSSDKSHFANAPAAYDIVPDSIQL